MENEISFSKEALRFYLEDDENTPFLFEKANTITHYHFNNHIYLRGIIEFSNICEKNCLYCGLRKNRKIDRFLLDKTTILELTKKIFDQGIYTLVLQSGECTSEKRMTLLYDIISKIKHHTNNKMAIVLSIGELSKQRYQKLYDAGADRYLLRIETSNPLLYQKIHPVSHSFQQRLECLYNLKEIGYEVGTGVMIGLPQQTLDDLADDLFFFQKLGVHMVGMGPYIPHHATPLFKKPCSFPQEQKLLLCYKMIALLRLTMPTINIAATTALDMIHPQGRIQGLSCGANVLMPRFTPVEIQTKYQLYERGLFKTSLQKIFFAMKKEGKKPAFSHQGDSKTFQKRR